MYMVFKAQEVGRFNWLKEFSSLYALEHGKGPERSVPDLLQIEECTTDAILFSFEDREVHVAWGMVLIYLCRGLNLLDPESGTVERCGPGGVSVSLWV